MPDMASRGYDVDERHFVNYIRVCLRRYAARWRRTLQVRLCRELAILDKPMDDGTEGITPVELLVPSGRSAEDEFLSIVRIEDLLLDARLAAAYRQLTKRERETVISLIIEGERQSVLAGRQGVTQQAVSRNRDRALRRLRRSI